MENFPESVLKTAVDNLLAHRSKLYMHPSTARNYGEMMAHFLVLSDYRHDELLDAMEECLNGFRSPTTWKDTATGCYCVFGSGLIGAFMNWEDMPFDQALSEWFRFKQGCDMKWRFVADPYGNWINAIPKEPEAIFGNPNYDISKYGLKARNKAHWRKKLTELVPQRNVELKLDSDSLHGEGEFSFIMAENHLSSNKELYFKATWSGAYDVSLNGCPVKQVRYNLPYLPAGWYIPADAAKTLRPGKNTVKVKLLGYGKEQEKDAPLSKKAPFIRLGLITWY